MNQVSTELRPSAAMQAYRDKMKTNSLNQALQEGVLDSFPTVSFRQGFWRVKFQGEEHVVKAPNNKPATEFDVVILAASRHITKQWYEKAFDTNAAVRPPPDCASIDGVRPDSGVPKPQSPTCAGCHNNVFGSAKNQDGTAAKGKACSDRRRIAVMIPPNILGEIKPALLTVPPTSLKNLKDYSRKLDGMGLEANMVVTRLGFQPTDKGGQVLTFEDQFVLPDREFETILKLATDETIERMLRAPITAANAEPLEEDRNAPEQEARPYTSFTEPRPTSHTADTKNAQVTPRPQATANDWPPPNAMQLKNGKWIDTETGEFLEPPAPPAPAANLKQLKNGQWVDLDTGEFVDPPGQAQTKSEPEIIPPGKTPARSFAAPADDEGEEDAKPAAPAPSGPAQARRRSRAAKAAPVTDAAPEAVSEAETVAHTNGNGTEQTVTKVPEKMLDVLGSLFPQG
jgi:hypothetical protein